MVIPCKAPFKCMACKSVSSISPDQVLEYLVGYIAEQIQNEIDFAKIYKPQGYQNFDANYQKGGLGEILGENRLKTLMTASDPNNRRLKESDVAAVRENLKGHLAKYKSELEKWGVIDPNGKNHIGLNKALATAYGGLDMTINTAFVNEIINHIEEIKFTTGDARMYKTSVDLFKRLAAISSTGNMLVNDAATNAIIRTEVANNEFTIVNPRTGKSVTQRYPLAPDGYFRGITIKENQKYVSHLLRTAVSSTGKPLVSKLTGEQESVIFMVYENQLMKDYADKNISSRELIAKIRAYEDKYRNVNENDGASWINIFSFKNYMIRRGSWTTGMEAVFQTERALLNAKSIDDIKNITITLNGRTFNPFVFGSKDTFGKRIMSDKVDDFEEFDAFHTLKSQYAGFTYSTEAFDMIQTQQEMQVAASSIFKTANHVIMPSAVIGTNLQQMNHLMLTRGVDVIHMGSANKVGGIDAKLAAQLKLSEAAEDNKHLKTIAYIIGSSFDLLGSNSKRGSSIKFIKAL